MDEQTQAFDALREFAKMIAVYYIALIDEGISHTDAITLAVEYQTATLDRIAKQAEQIVPAS